MSGHSKWANIKHKKARVDEKRGKLFTKLGIELVMAARQGGGDPEANLRLKMAIQKAKEANMPSENIQRVIQRATGNLEGANYEELVYEGYGPGGVAVLLQITTDNRNRTASEIRHIFSKNGGNLGESGCVAWMFSSKGLLTLDLEKSSGDPEEITLQAIEAGVEDVEAGDNSLQVITAPGELEGTRAALEGMGIRVKEAEVTMLPQNTLEIADPEKARQILRLLDALEDHDDVQAVHANVEIPEEVLDKLGEE